MKPYKNSKDQYVWDWGENLPLLLNNNNYKSNLAKSQGKLWNCIFLSCLLSAFDIYVSITASQDTSLIEALLTIWVK